MAAEMITGKRTKTANNATRKVQVKVVMIALLMCIDATVDGSFLNGRAVLQTCIRRCQTGFLNCISKTCPTSISKEKNKEEHAYCNNQFQMCRAACDDSFQSAERMDVFGRNKHN
ncbi:hypothetical protein LSAT2_007540 [Lamellibrachia satsuma]|nr:hypothetical protein LSAT2_007540 [Lamellibrachia satsuma]